MALFVGSASVVILRTRILWRWLPVLGFIAAVPLVIGATWPIDGNDEGALAIPGFISALVTLLFVVLFSINMLMLMEEPAPTERSASGAPVVRPAV